MIKQIIKIMMMIITMLIIMIMIIDNDTEKLKNE